MKEGIIVFLLAMFFIFLVVLFSPPAINVYQSISTGQIVKVETKDGVVTDPVEIKEVLSGRYDGVTYYLP